MTFRWINLECPGCGSSSIRKNGHRKGKQNHICSDCHRQFIDAYEPHLGYSDEFKQECLKMYVNGLGFRGIERVKGVHHTTVITWVKASGLNLPDAYEPEPIPDAGELDERDFGRNNSPQNSLMNWKPLPARKQNLALDSGRPFPQGPFGLGIRRP